MKRIKWISILALLFASIVLLDCSGSYNSLTEDPIVIGDPMVNIKHRIASNGVNITCLYTYTTQFPAFFKDITSDEDYLYVLMSSHDGAHILGGQFLVMNLTTYEIIYISQTEHGHGENKFYNPGEIYVDDEYIYILDTKYGSPTRPNLTHYIQWYNKTDYRWVGACRGLDGIMDRPWSFTTNVTHWYIVDSIGIYMLDSDFDLIQFYPESRKQLAGLRHSIFYNPEDNYLYIGIWSITSGSGRRIERWDTNLTFIEYVTPTYSWVDIPNDIWIYDDVIYTANGFRYVGNEIGGVTLHNLTTGETIGSLGDKKVDNRTDFFVKHGSSVHVTSDRIFVTKYGGFLYPSESVMLVWSKFTETPTEFYYTNLTGSTPYAPVGLPEDSPEENSTTEEATATIEITTQNPATTTSITTTATIDETTEPTETTEEQKIVNNGEKDIIEEMEHPSGQTSVKDKVQSSIDVTPVISVIAIVPVTGYVLNRAKKRKKED